MFNQVILFNELRGNEMVGTLALPSFEATGSSTAPNTLAGDFPLPALSIAGHMVGMLGTVKGDLPLPTGSFLAGGGGEMSGALPIIEGACDAGALMGGNLALPTMSFSGSVAHVGTLAGELPGIIGNFTAGGSCSGGLPLLDGEMSGTSGSGQVSGSMAGTLPKLAGDVQGLVEIVGGMSGSLPKLSGSIAGTQEGAAGGAGSSVTGSIDGDLPVISLSLSVSVGVLASISGDIPVVTFAASGGNSASGSMTGTLPIPEMVLTALGTRTTLAVNVATGAVTEYQGFLFDSYAGEYAAGPNGLYKLTGSTDAGAAISAWFDIGPLPLADVQTYVHDCFVNARIEGDLELSADVDDGEQELFVTDAPGIMELRAHRIPMARGMKGKDWHLRWQNVSGGDFEVDEISLDVVKSTRRSR